ncbi:MAG: urea transporter [Acidobacteria bacterium]|nr:urea transporter [Acidobacteriota bacterium]
MSLRLSSSGLKDGDATSLQHIPVMADTLLRGLGQVMLQNNSYTGLLFLAGIAANSLLFAAAALVGTATSTLTAIVLGADRASVRAGMFGFNGALVAIALLYFLAPTTLTWACVILASACSTVLMTAMLTAFNVWELPVLTAPFVLTSLAFFLSVARFGRLYPTGHLPTAGLPVNAAVEGVVTGATVGEGLLTGIGQVFFQGNVVSGALFAAGLFVSSRRACAAALTGSISGLLVAWGMGAAEPAIRAGAFGFNSVLTAIALASVFFASGTTSAIYAVAGATVAPFVAAACAAALEPLGMPAMTLPFVLTTWVFLLAGRGFSKIEPA